MKKIVILGGGISGLGTAHFLEKIGHEVYVLDENSVPGGKITTSKYEDCFCEMGPNTVLMNTEGMVQLLKDHELFNQMIHPNPKAHENRFISVNNKLVKVPVKPIQVLFHPLIGWKNRLKLLRLPFRIFGSVNANENLKDYMTKRFGKDVFRYFVSPFVNGIYAGDPNKILAKYALKLIYQSEHNAKGKLFKGIIAFMKERKRFKQKHQLPDQLMFTLKGGLGTIGQRIATQLDDRFISGAQATKIVKISSGYSIEYQRGDKIHTIEAEKVISTIPPDQFTLLENNLASVDQLKLQKIPQYAPVKVLHMVFNKNELGLKEEGFGVLSLPEDNRKCMGVLFNSSTFPDISPEGKSLFTAFVGGSRQAELCNLPEQELKDAVVSEIKKILKTNSEPDWVNIKYWKKGIPQFEQGHEDFLQSIAQIESENKGLYFAGNYLRAVSVSECAQEGMELAERIHFCE